jgi:hypothetical protein
MDSKATSNVARRAPGLRLLAAGNALSQFCSLLMCLGSARLSLALVLLVCPRALVLLTSSFSLVLLVLLSGLALRGDFNKL